MPGADPGTTASYIASMTGDLSVMARRQGLDMLAYVLDMARLEAETVARSSPPPP